MTIFSPEQLATLVKAIPQDLPHDHMNAVVAGVDQTGAQVLVGFRKEAGGSTWEAQGAYRHTWTGDNQAGARLLVSWK